jgi:hypothetical protein
MPEEIIFEELSKRERLLLLRAFDYDIDNKGYIVKPSGKRILSKEFPNECIQINKAAFVPGSLGIIDGTPTAISKFIREKVEKKDGSTTT